MLCKYVKYLICSEDFANEVTGMTITDDYEDICKVYRKLRNLYPYAKITITIGAKGYIYEEDGIILVKPAYQPEEKTIDTNCAGDIFHGAFTHAISNGYSYKDSLEFANITASISTTRRGGRTSVPELEEVEEIMKKGEKPYVKKFQNKTNSI